MPKRIKLFIIIVLAAFFVLACDSKRVFDDYTTLPDSWNKDKIVSFEVEQQDTMTPYNLFLNLRANKDYKYNNIFIIAELNYPNGKAITDTLEYKMAAPNGELLGKGFSDVKESKLWYKGYENDFVFSEKGVYKVNVQHAMRKNGEIEGVENLEGITEVGFRIEKK